MDTLVVILAAVGDSPEDIRRHGLLRYLWDAGCRCDVKIIYYTGPAYALGRLGDEMHEELKASSAEAEYGRRVWVGISGGGMAVLEMARQYPGDVDALVLISPYLGSKYIISEIERAGGVMQWSPYPPIEQMERTWQFIQGYGTGESRPPIALMYGANDPGVRAQRLLAEVLPEPSVRETDGAHGWPTFETLWQQYLDSRPDWLQ